MCLKNIVLFYHIVPNDTNIQWRRCFKWSICIGNINLVITWFGLKQKLLYYPPPIKRWPVFSVAAFTPTVAFKRSLKTFYPLRLFTQFVMLLLFLLFQFVIAFCVVFKQRSSCLDMLRISFTSYWSTALKSLFFKALFRNKGVLFKNQ